MCRWWRWDLTHTAGPGVSLENSFKYPGSVCVDEHWGTDTSCRQCCGLKAACFLFEPSVIWNRRFMNKIFRMWHRPQDHRSNTQFRNMDQPRRCTRKTAVSHDANGCYYILTLLHNTALKAGLSSRGAVWMRDPLYKSQRGICLFSAVNTEEVWFM